MNYKDNAPVYANSGYSALWTTPVLSKDAVFVIFQKWDCTGEHWVRRSYVANFCFCMLTCSGHVTQLHFSSSNIFNWISIVKSIEINYSQIPPWRTFFLCVVAMSAVTRAVNEFRFDRVSFRFVVMKRLTKWISVSFY
jgi:hypothetical protein